MLFDSWATSTLFADRSKEQMKNSRGVLEAYLRKDLLIFRWIRWSTIVGFLLAHLPNNFIIIIKVYQIGIE